MPHCNKQMISFFLTTKCNLCCQYCYNASERAMIKEQTLNPRIAEVGIDWYFSSSSSRHIRFYGPGEPTRAFEQLKRITKYAKEHPLSENRVTVEIQTNGIFRNAVRNWLLKNANIIWLSFDGMCDIQNFYRPLNPKYTDIFGGRTSANILEDNVKWFIDKRENRNLMVGARVTMTEKNIERQCEMVDYFHALGIRYI